MPHEFCPRNDNDDDQFMGSRLSMASCADITQKYARAYAQASKKDKGMLLDEVCAVTGWSRDNARRRLARAR